MYLKKADGFSLYKVIIFILIITTLFIFILLILFFSGKSSLIQEKKFREYLALRSAVSRFLVLPDNPDSAKFIINRNIILVKSKNTPLVKEIWANSVSFKTGLHTKVASIPHNYYENALTISKKQVNLVEAGNITIKGKIVTANKKIARRNLPGVFTFHKFIDKSLVFEDNNIPPRLYKNINFDSLFYDKNFSRYEIITGNVNASDLTDYKAELIRVEGNLILDENYISEKIPVIYVTGETKISNCSKLNIGSIICDSTVSVSNCKTLNQISIIASKNIIIDNLLNTNLISILGKKNITVKNSSLFYPSFIAIENGSQKEKYPKLKIDNSVITGTLALFSEHLSETNKSIININKTSKIKGYIYSEAKVELSGTLTGSMFTWQIRKFKKPTEYINWLVDLNINRNLLGSNCLLPLIMNNNNKYHIIDEKITRKP